MLRIVQESNALPFSFPVDPSATFQPGQVAQLTTNGNVIVCGVSDGTAPLGIIDDVKTNAFTSNAVDEVLIIPATGVINSNGRLVTPVDIKAELQNPSVVERSFTSDVDVSLKARNGVITVLAGTELNFDNAGTGTPDSIRVVVSYTYQVPNIPGDNSTAGTGRVTVWVSRIIAQTDQFETNQRYPLNCPLYVSEAGMLTSRQPTPNHASIAICTAPPTALHTSLEFMLL